MMGKLTENFNKFDNIQNKYLQVQADITEFEIKNKDNEVLQQYKKLLDKKQKIENSIKEYKDILYTGMLEEDLDLLEGKYIDVTLKRPYYKTEFDLSKFKKDYKPESSMYKKYVKQKLVKGNIIIKDPQAK